MHEKGFFCPVEIHRRNGGNGMFDITYFKLNFIYIQSHWTIPEREVTLGYSPISDSLIYIIYIYISSNQWLDFKSHDSTSSLVLNRIRCLFFFFKPIHVTFLHWFLVCFTAFHITPLNLSTWCTSCFHILTERDTSRFESLCRGFNVFLMEEENDLISFNETVKRNMANGRRVGDYKSVCVCALHTREGEKAGMWESKSNPEWLQGVMKRSCAAQSGRGALSLPVLINASCVHVSVRACVTCTHKYDDIQTRLSLRVLRQR